jgi:predicted PP-loop superfamily ATPase
MNISKQKFGSLQIKIPQSIQPGSHKKVEWICDCGKETLVCVYKVISGHTKSCGRCNEILADEFAKKKFGKLRVKTPENTLPGSARKIEWICDCGNTCEYKIIMVTNGSATTCGKCNEISAEEISKRKFGKLRIKVSKNILPGSNKKVAWICDCGRETSIPPCRVFAGKTTSCGRCKEIHVDENRKFGKLRIKKSQNVMPGSAKKIEWLCDCGRETKKQIDSVFNGRTSSCGDCHGTIFDWYLVNKEKIRSLKYPINPKYVPPGGIIPLEIITKSHVRFKTNCPSCKKLWTGHWADIKQGIALTCGCTFGKISSVQRRIFEFIKQYDPGVQLEYKLGTSYYDIFVPSKNLLIEYDGTMWHSKLSQRERDLKKHKYAVDCGYKFMRISEKDWKLNKKHVEYMISALFI